MRIALISTCALSTPPRRYGGTELFVATLARELARRGHSLTVYATGDSRPAGTLRSLFPRPCWPPSDLAEAEHAGFAWQDVAARAFDVVHVQHAHALPFTRLVTTPCVHTVHHDRLPVMTEHYRRHPEVSFVAISHRQAELVPELSFARAIHHGIDPAAYPLSRAPSRAAAFLGRFAPEKGPEIAIDAARAAGLPIELGGAAHWVAQAFYEREMVPRLDLPGVRGLGELDHAEKVALLSRSGVLLVPVQWEEPFGLVMIEAMMVGTPVVAFARGSAPEVIENGVTGFVVRDFASMVRAARDALALDRARVRERAIARFSAVRMADEYEDLYRQVVRRASQRQAALRVVGREV